MRAITKRTEPASLIAHRKKPHSGFSNYNAHDKDELRIALVAEQRGLCCYCMRRIRPARDAMKIEHWQSQGRYPSQQLSYENMLGVCLGGQDKPGSKQHCDTRKGSRDLKWNPANPRHRIETRVRFDRDGSIRSSDDDFCRQLNEVLNLNLPWLKSNREAVVRGIEESWKEVRSRRPAARDRLVQRMRSAYLDAEGELAEYCQVALYWLDKVLPRKTP